LLGLDSLDIGEHDSNHFLVKQNNQSTECAASPYLPDSKHIIPMKIRVKLIAAKIKYLQLYIIEKCVSQNLGFFFFWILPWIREFLLRKKNWLQFFVFHKFCNLRNLSLNKIGIFFCLMFLGFVWCFWTSQSIFFLFWLNFYSSMGLTYDVYNLHIAELAEFKWFSSFVCRFC
jgi:hypothetical protein